MLIRASILLMCAFSSAISAYAELATLGVDISRGADGSVRVSIVSGVPAQVKKDISVDAAAKALRAIQPTEDAILVGIIVRGNVQAGEYLPIIKAIAEAGQDLAFIDGQGPDYVRDNIRRRITSGR